MATNQFNAPPADGRQFFMVRLEATRTYRPELNRSLPKDVAALHAKSGTLSGDVIGVYSLDNGNVAYATFRDSCGVIPDQISSATEVFQGGTITGNVCWSVNSDNVGSLVMYVDEGFRRSPRVFLAVR